MVILKREFPDHYNVYLKSYPNTCFLIDVLSLSIRDSVIDID